MASSSTSSVHEKYEVFLSFRGEDTRRGFVSHLYSALQRKSILTYKDDKEIKKGERISDDLLRSIENSKFYIIVFSKNYASSSWCLKELVKIMDCQTMPEHTAFPIFYDVEPTDVRKQSGPVGEAFSKHENDEAAGNWRKALEEAAGLAGWELKDTANGDEADLIKIVVERISLELRSISFSVDEQLVGMETRVQDVVSSLGTGLGDVCMIGIKGIGGGGKTTLARAVFDKISCQFEGTSFVENVREVSKASSSGLKSLQKQILSDVLNDKDISLSGVHEGKKLMQKFMCNRKVLVVLDDVDGREQLEALAGKPSWFKMGSIVIITTRDEQVLVAHGVKSIRNVDLLSEMEALFLFNWYAFGKEIPVQGYEELSKRVVCYANGLPLTITVLGSFLCGKDEFEWRDALDRLKTIPLHETLTQLELSYTGLEEDYKEIFLDVACILKGWRKKDAIQALESRGFHARNGLRVLEQRSLITISISYGREVISMHDHLEEMGRNIVRRSHPDKPHKHTRLWIADEIDDILSNNTGTEATRCILFEKRRVDLQIVMKGLRKMKELRFLSVSQKYGSELEKSSPYFLDDLRFLCWESYPFRTLPEAFQATNLVALQMTTSNIVQLWEGGERKVLNKLKFLNLSHSMLRTLDLGQTPNLETLDLEGCRGLVELHIPVVCPKLRSLYLSDSELKTLDLGQTANLETLDLQRCCGLVELHLPVVCPKLRSFYLSDSKLRTLDLGQTPNLEILDIKECLDLVKLHMPDRCPNLKSLKLNRLSLKNLAIGLTPNLESLDLTSSPCLEELHMADEHQKLKEFKLVFSSLRILDLGTVPNLENLYVADCPLVELQMRAELQQPRYIHLMRSMRRTIDLGLPHDLEKLNLEHGIGSVHFHMPVGRLNLRNIFPAYLELWSLDLKMVPYLDSLDIAYTAGVEAVHMSGELRTLQNLKLSGLEALRTLEHGLSPYPKHLELHNLVGTTLDLATLDFLCIEDCHDLVELHMPNERHPERLRYLKCSGLELLSTINLGLSPNLKHLKLSHLTWRAVDLGMFPDLKRLRIKDCHDMAELHMPGKLQTLHYLKFSRLESLRTLDLGMFPNLKHLKLGNLTWRTVDLRMFPDLECLSIKECHDLVELHMPGEPKKLRYLKFSGLESLRTLDPGLFRNVKHLKLIHLTLRTVDLGMFPDLKHLCIEDCHDLVELHMPSELQKLQYLNFTMLKLLRTVDLGMFPDLEHLCIEDCHDLVELHMPSELHKLQYLNFTMLDSLRTLDLGMTPNLAHLDLKRCYGLKELHLAGECQKRASLNISGTRLRSLDLRMVPDLGSLILDQCNNLIELHMPARCPNLKSFKVANSKLRTLHIGLNPDLEDLQLRNCYDLRELCMANECQQLTSLNIHDLSLWSLDLRMAPNLESLTLDQCNNLMKLKMPTRCLNLKSFKLTNSKLRTLDIGLTPDLVDLQLRKCYDLRKLQMTNECQKLASLNISDSGLRTIDLGMAPNINSLILDQCNDLVELHLPGRYLNLTSLKLNGSMLRTPEIGQTPNVEYLDIQNCCDPEELHLADECQKLESINISGSRLRTLDLRLAPNLKTLVLDGCNDLVELHMPDRCLNLTSVKLNSSKLRIHNIRLTPNLESLDLKYCFQLEEPHLADEYQKLRFLDLSYMNLRTLDLGLAPNLETLILDECKDLVELHMPGVFLNLTSLKITNSKLRTFDVGLAPNLKNLDLKRCFDLAELGMAHGGQELASLNISNSKLTTLDLGLIPNLEKLDLKGCDKLVELQVPMGCLKKLAYLDLSGCLRFRKFVFHIEHVTSCSDDDKSLKVGPLAELHLIAESVDICPIHPDNILPKFEFTCFYKEDVPSLTRNVEKLISLGLCACTNLERFSGSICGLKRLRKLKLEGSFPEAPKDLDQLVCLEELSLSSAKIKYLPESICRLKNLKSLELNGCPLLEKLPEDIGRLESLETLVISECASLQDIPNSICKMKCLEVLRLCNCNQIEKLPEELGSLERLIELFVDGTGISRLPQSILLLKGLSIFGSRELLQSVGFTIRDRNLRRPNVVLRDRIKQGEMEGSV